MKNILFIITKSEIGGAQKFVQEQIVICSNEFNIFLCTNKVGWLTEKTKDYVKDVFLNTEIEGKASLLFLFNLIKFIKKNKIELVITNSANAGFYGRVAAFFANTKSCYFSHGWSSVYNGGKFSFILNFLEKVLAIISSKVICVSESDYAIAKHNIGISESKLLIAKNATLPIIKQREQNRKPDSKLKVLTLTRFAHPKRIDLLVEAFSEIQFAILYVAGNGPDFNYWENYIHENEINNIQLLGEVPSFAAFHEYDVFMLISDSEGLPISAIEAMSAGLPLVLSNVGGCGELISNNGILVNNSTEEIASALKTINENYSYYQNNSLQFYHQSFNLETHKNRYLELYNNL